MALLIVMRSRMTEHARILSAIEHFGDCIRLASRRTVLKPDMPRTFLRARGTAATGKQSDIVTPLMSGARRRASKTGRQDRANVAVRSVSDGEASQLSLMTKVEVREIMGCIKRLDDPIRYVVYNQIGRMRFFLDVSRGTFAMNSLNGVTFFKRKDIAILVAKRYMRGKRPPLAVAKITVRNGNPKLLRWTADG